MKPSRKPSPENTRRLMRKLHRQGFDFALDPHESELLVSGGNDELTERDRGLLETHFTEVAAMARRAEAQASRAIEAAKRGSWTARAKAYFERVHQRETP